MANSICKLKQITLFQTIMFLAVFLISFAAVIYLLVYVYPDKSNIAESYTRWRPDHRLIDFTDADPNIHPTPLPQPAVTCSGTGFKININSNISVVPQSKTYTHSNAGACEVECSINRTCFGINYDSKDQYDKMKKCTLYSGSTSNAPGSIKANTICSRTPPTCTIPSTRKYPANYLLKNITPTGLNHTNERACAVECTNRNNCEGYLYDTTSKENAKPCYIFGKADAGATIGFPAAGVCPKPDAPKPAPKPLAPLSPTKFGTWFTDGWGGKTGKNPPYLEKKLMYDQCRSGCAADPKCKTMTGFKANGPNNARPCAYYDTIIPKANIKTIGTGELGSWQGSISYRME